jgi:hypothetical protein
MSQTFGIESSGQHPHSSHRAPARYLVLIETAGAMVARLFLATREAAGEFDAGVEEVVNMTSGLTPQAGAAGPEWDQALQGHSASERSAARVYTLDV